ncbi:MAG: tetratricopeptide repeat protein, partial [bacterium]
MEEKNNQGSSQPFNPKDAKDWVKKGVELWKLGKLQEALKCFDQSIILDSNNIKAWFNKGVTLGNLKRLEEEIKVYDDLVARFEQAQELAL